MVGHCPVSGPVAMAGVLDPYNFDAPSTYINFNSFHEDHNADSWFDQVTNALNTPPNQRPRCKTSEQKCKVKTGETTLSEEAVSKSTTHGKSLSRRSTRLMSRKHQEKLLIKLRESHVENESPQADSPLCQQKGRRNVLVKAKIAEQQELEKIQELQKEMLETLKKNEHSMKAAITRAGQSMNKGVPPVTKPFVLQRKYTDQLEHNSNQPEGDGCKVVDFVASLRKHQPPLVQIPKRGYTIPKPFNLSQGRKRKREEALGSTLYKRPPPLYCLYGHQRELEEEEVPVVKGSCTPHYRVLFKPKLVEKRQVEVCPFSFSERDKERQLQKEKRLDELRKLEVYRFKAQPLPPFYHISPFKKKVKLPTQTEPFDLESSLA